MKHTIEQIARATHAVNRAYCEQLGDMSQVHWSEAPDWQKKSAIAGVKAVIDGTANTPEEQHEQWMMIKIEGGWNWGVSKCAEKKTHPCLVPYDQLPASQQAKDVIFRAVVEGMRG